jgi:uncharacterized protein
MNLKIAPGLNLPADVVTQTFAILAIRRVGKTYTASVLAEEMMKAKLPFVALDPTGAWWGLRASADGKREGYPVVIIGGAHGDVPLEPTAGKVLADLVVDHPGWYVIDMSQTASRGEQDRIARDFAEQLYRRKASATFPLHLFVDEADSFAPQQSFPDQKAMLGAFEALVRRGGIRGIGTTLITQRPAVLNKNLLTQADNLIVLRVTSPQDRAAIDDWVKGNGTKEERDTMMSGLASLQQGEAWFWSPGTLGVFQKIKIRQRETFNSSATPKTGEQRIEPAKLASVDLDALRDKISATIEKAKADDPKLLRQRIVELERQLKQQPTAIADQSAIDRAVVEAERRFALIYAEAERKYLVQIRELTKKLEQIRGIAETSEFNAPAIEKPQIVQIAAPARAIPPRQQRPSKAPQPTTDGISGAEQRILNSLAWWESIGIAEPSRAMTAFGAGYTVNGHFNNLAGGLRSRGLVNYPKGDCLALTEAGRASAVEPDSPPTADDLHDRVRQKLSGAQQRLFDVLIERYGQGPVSNEDLAAGAGYTVNGHFNNLRGSLRSLQLIEYVPGGSVASEWLFAI